MQAILLTAGKNSRFFPLNTITHKAMFPLYGRPILEYLIQDLKKAGVDEIIIVGGKFLDKIKTYFQTQNLQIEIIFARQKEPKGQADAILSAKKYIKDDFLVINPYHILQVDIFEDILNILRTDRSIDAIFPGIHEKNITNYGALILKDKFVKGIIEKPNPKNIPSNYRATSAYGFRKKFLTYLEKTPISENSYEEACNIYAKENNILFYKINKNRYIPTLKYPWHLLQIFSNIHQYYKRGKIHPTAQIHPTAIIDENSIIDENAKILEYAVIKGHTYIGKNSIVGNNAIIRDSNLAENTVVGVSSEIARSIILTNSTFHGSGFIGDSIVGTSNKIGAGFVTANKRFDRDNIRIPVKGTIVNTYTNSLGVITGENIKIGISVSTMPGTIIKSNTIVYPKSLMQGVN